MKQTHAAWQKEGLEGFWNFLKSEGSSLSTCDVHRGSRGLPDAVIEIATRVDKNFRRYAFITQRYVNDFVQYEPLWQWFWDFGLLENGILLKH
jgi:hypothetical protein